MSATSSSGTPVRPLRWRDLRWPVKLGTLAILAGLLLGGLELASRVYWSAIRGVLTV